LSGGKNGYKKVMRKTESKIEWNKDLPSIDYTVKE